MAASSFRSLEENSPSSFTKRDISYDASHVRRTLEQEQKNRADTNLMTLRCMAEASRDVNEDHDDFIDPSICEHEHPNWLHYDPLDKSERIHRFPIKPEHHGILHMVNVTYSNVAVHLNECIKRREMGTGDEKAWLQSIADRSGGALRCSDQYWNFKVMSYKDLTFTAHQLLFFDVKKVKLFIIVVNQVHPFDFFFYFF